LGIGSLAAAIGFGAAAFSSIGTIVSGKENKGIVLYVVLSQHGEQLADRIVDRHNRAFVGVAVSSWDAIPVMLRCVFDLRMNGEWREVEKEGFVCISIDELGHVIAIEVGEVRRSCHLHVHGRIERPERCGRLP